MNLNSKYGLTQMAFNKPPKHTLKNIFMKNPHLPWMLDKDALIPPNTAFQLVNNSFAQDTSNLIYSWDPPSYLDDPNKEPIFTAPTEGDYGLPQTDYRRRLRTNQIRYCNYYSTVEKNSVCICWATSGIRINRKSSSI